MNAPFDPISPAIPAILHGADYNPEQWLDYPEIFEEDLAYMKECRINVLSIGIFSWVSLEPEEGRYTFDWLDHVLDRLAEEHIYVFLATPSGARPAWMSKKYPEVLRVRADRRRNLHGERHNHCFTSPIYKAKTAEINQRISERYKNHSAVIGWHISNEYGGECHCDYCQEAFRTWLKRKYGSLQCLNHAWWTTFWSHTFTEWEEIESPSPIGEKSVHGLLLDWKRFVTDQTIEFYKHEVEAVRRSGSNLPATTNFMECFEGLDYWKFAEHVDVVSWDSYPLWHHPDPVSEPASWTAFNHDLMRSLGGGRPFMLMESTPAQTNWQPVSKLKKPGMHQLSALQAVAHGADTVQYFQWRQSRGSSEKFHGSVVGHEGSNSTRTFREVKQLGQQLENLNNVVGSVVPAKAAIMFDWHNRWAIKESQGPRNCGIEYEDTVHEHYMRLWEKGIPVDIVSPASDLSAYDFIAAPLLYMMTEKAAEKLENYVHQGGTLLATYWSGVVNENDLVYRHGRVSPFTRVTGVFPEEIDALYNEEKNRAKGEFEGSVYQLCEISHLQGANVLSAYKDDFYKGSPLITNHSYGSGACYYLAARPDVELLRKLYSRLIEKTDLQPAAPLTLPEGVHVHKRTNGHENFLFFMNFNAHEVSITLNRPLAHFSDRIHMEPFDSFTLEIPITEKAQTDA